MLCQLSSLLLQGKPSLTSTKIKLVPKCLRLPQPGVEGQIGVDKERRRDGKKTRDSLRSQNCRGVTGARPPIVTNDLQNADSKCIGQIDQVLAKSSRLSRSGSRRVHLSRAKSPKKRPDQMQAMVTTDPVNDLVETRWIIRKTVQKEELPGYHRIDGPSSRWKRWWRRLSRTDLRSVR